MTKLEKVYMTILIFGIVVTLCIELLSDIIWLGIFNVIKCILLMVLAIKLYKFLHKKGILDSLFMRDNEEKNTIAYSEEEKKIAAYHEAGHAIVCKSLPIVKSIENVSIDYKGDNDGGHTNFSIIKKQKFITKTEIQNYIVLLLAGRAAERIALQEISSGASEYLENATVFAREMITMYGLDEEIGPISFEGDNANTIELFGTEIFNKIGDRIQKILKESEKKSERILIENREVLDRVAEELMESGTVSGEELEKIIEVYK